jgi:long-chain acyl-CoA synthetase
MAALASVEVPGSARPDLGLGGVRRCALPVGAALSVDGLNTIFEVFQRSALVGPERPCLGHRPVVQGVAGAYVWQTYRQVYERALAFGAGLKHLKVCVPNTHDGLVSVGFYSKNTPSYVIGDLGALSQKIVPVPLYDTLGADSVEYCVRQTEMKALLCSVDVFGALVEVAAKGLLTTAILMDTAGAVAADRLSALRAQGQKVGLTVYTMEEVEALGKKHPTPPTLPSGDDVAFFCYTSGTTGDPKGGMIRHSGIVSCLAALREYGLEMFPTDVHLSYLPLPHVFERSILLAVIYGGGSVGFFQGDTLKILDDLQALRPTIFPSVPRLLNRIHAKLLAGVKEAGGVKQWLFERALAAKVAGLRQGQLEHPLWDRLVFKAVKSKVGLDRVRMIMTGSAPIADHVLDFLRAVFACPVHEGYGQTESSLLISFTSKEDLTVGHVGVPAPCNEIRLVDVPDMNYLCTDKKHNDGSPCLGRGEIVFRGPNVFKGYYRMPDKTAETVDADGWCHTGDIGLWTPNGKLRIIDRKKNIFKLAQGEYIAVEKVENILTRADLVLQCFVYGDSLQNSLVVVAVPDPETLAKRGIKPDDPKLAQIMLQQMAEEAKKADLKGFEIPKACYVEQTAFDQQRAPANGLPAREKLLTPTFKLQRNKAKEYYKDNTDIVNTLYKAVVAKEAATQSKL